METEPQKKRSFRNAIDPRYFVVINHSILIVLGMTVLGLQRSVEQVAFCLFCVILAEIAFARITLKQPIFLPFDRLYSALVLALSSVILVRAYEWWFYGVIGIVGVASKYLILNHNGRHIYNPTNVAIVFAVIMIPDGMVVRPDSFAGHIVPMLSIIILGGIAITMANVWRCTLGYVLGVAAIGIPVGAALGYPWLLVIGPIMNTSSLLFAVLMLTDPQTTPRAPREQWMFGLLIGCVDLVLRYYELYYSQFLALFLVLSFSGVLFKTSAAYRSPNMMRPASVAA